MLSSQTKDTTNALTMRRLQTELPSPGCTLQNILEVEPDKLNKMIWAVGFHNNKTRYIKAAAEILRDQHKGDIPDTPEGLMALPGVGPKMAYLCMSAAWGRHEGIGVDVHVCHFLSTMENTNDARSTESPTSGAGTKPKNRRRHGLSYNPGCRGTNGTRSTTCSWDLVKPSVSP